MVVQQVAVLVEHKYPVQQMTKKVGAWHLVTQCEALVAPDQYHLGAIGTDFPAAKTLKMHYSGLG